nr:DNA helicase [Tanacetum cinerariifolium]
MKTKNKPVKRKMPYDLQMEYTSLHIPKKLDLKFHDTACASVPHDGRNYNSRLSLPTNPVHETSAPSNIDVIKEAYEFAYNQTNNDDSLTMHTETQDMLSTTIGNHTATSSLGTFGIQNNSFPRKRNVTNNDIKDPHTCIRHRQKQYATRIHWRISDNQQVAPSKKEGSDPRFLQLYIYDTTNEVKNRMAHFDSNHRNGLKKEIVEDLIEFLDNHNALVQLFRTVRDKYMDSEIPKFKVRLYNVVGTRRYEVPTPEAVGAIVFGDSSTKDNEFDLIVEEHSRFPQRVNKLHPCYMSLQFPLLFVYGEEGYHKEFQKRGLPHCHSLLWLNEASKIHEDGDVDKYISVELPNPTNDAGGYRVISELMMHGPCGYANLNATCMKDGTNCNLNFPKPYSDRTFVDKEGYVYYRRRKTGVDIERQGVRLDNSKGTDRVVMNVTKPSGDTASTSTTANIQIDEIKNFVEAGYIGPHEACWRILDFPIHYRDPAVQILAVHSENMQRITFKAKEKIPKFKVRLYNVVGTRRYEVPTPEAIGAIVFCDSSTKDNEFDLIVEEHSRFPQRVNKLHPCYMSLQFPLLLVYGEEGYHKGLKLVNVPRVSTKGQRQMSMNMYYSYQIHDRLNHYSLLPRGGKLFQQYAVTAYYAIEQDRLDYIRKNQSEIRNEYLSGLYDAITHGDRDVLYTIEFQKRGLPHCHSLLWLNEASKIHENSDVEKYISAELPNPTNDADGYRVISELIMHGPCGYANLNATCIKDETNCNRNFPKPYSDRTFVDKEGYVHYRRRKTGVDIERQGVRLDNSKGTDRVVMNVTKPTGDTASTSTTTNIQIDKIKNFVEARYIGPHEACWRILDFPIHYRDPVVQILASILGIQQIILAKKKGCRSFLEIRTVNNTLYPTNKAACEALGLLGGDQEWIEALHEAKESATSSELRKLSKTLHLPQIEKTEAKMKASVLFDLEAMLNSNSKSLKDFGLSMPPQDMLKILQNKLLMEEKKYNPELLAKEKDALIPRLNTEQKDIFDEIVNAVTNNIQKLIFAPMSDRHCFEALDRSLKDILNHSNTTFEGKSIILGEDFRQTLPVKKKSSKIEIVDASITSSYLWPCFKTYTLKENMRLTQPHMTEHEKEQKKTFSDWLLNIGDGTIGTCTESDTEDSATVQIPHELCIQESDTALTKLINFIYNEGTLHRPTAKELQKKAIVCPKNETTDMINAKVLSLLD